ncbi:putative cation exchanger C521.04c [Lingula anatina]|uniref:Cation exchanger C521.04c n=1 Tax=Lingula anatina TaxID=7574 RepID=A0A1S3ICB8_LINAN|nr:putative cation exchanger C521.04c [Lingula anatina]|eukprot:XP_013395905.1 putative cation exchanger C521.04c [Lingula anatina]
MDKGADETTTLLSNQTQNYGPGAVDQSIEISDQGRQSPEPSTPPVGLTSSMERNKNLRQRHLRSGEWDGAVDGTSSGDDGMYVFVQKPENEVEAQRMQQNYMFGFKKWKSHVTARPLADRSDIVKQLYAEQEKVPPPQVSVYRPSNFLYVILLGWWIALLYCIVGCLMLFTIIGRKYAFFCWKMAGYFFWPFGKFVSMVLPRVIRLNESGTLLESRDRDYTVSDTVPLVSGTPSLGTKHSSYGYWKHPQTYVWLVLGLPLLFIVHGVVFLLSWFLVITIPVAKLNLKAIRVMLFLPPDTVQIKTSSMSLVSPDSEIIIYTHQSVNFYYYKYTVDGMNVILVNLLVFVLLSLVLGYADRDNHLTGDVTKFILSFLALIPLSYYIGMAITSISAQSNFAVGALLNATFGSIVEISLYTVALVKGRQSENTKCYSELVKSALAGTLLGTMLLVPVTFAVAHHELHFDKCPHVSHPVIQGLCMIIGGLKHRLQVFNPRSVGVSSSLLFVSVAGAFTPTIFSKAYGTLQCGECVYDTNRTTSVLPNTSYALQCQDCEYSVFGFNGDHTLYDNHIRPLVYACALVLPIAYLIGLIFTMKTHKSHIHDKFMEEAKSRGTGDGHGTDVHWGRIKSTVILLCSVILTSLSADIATEHIQPVLENSSVSLYFLGVTLLALVPDIPEVVNGIQFALQNNVNLSIEVGTTTAVQVCMLQMPLLVLLDLIYPVDFYLIFSDLHLWAVIFSVIVMNYVFQDGKSNYFQGSALFMVYVLLILMYFFSPAGNEVCGSP